MDEEIATTCPGDELGDDDSLLRAVARAPYARAELAEGASSLPDAIRAALADRPHPQEAFTQDASKLPVVGAVIDGRYHIDARLGAGGMGVVFAATHLQTQRPVALKWMHGRVTAYSDSERASARRRFEREARIAARVRHENLVDVYDASSDEARSYLVMERLQGETLGARMRRGVLPWDELCALLLPTMRGVAALHAQGVIHRDLKPENIFLAEQGQACPKVLDFGVAALREAEPVATDETLTRPGSVLGTPGYMPLEQLRGERALDARTDVYALGVVAYEALSGQRPFRAGNAAEHAALLASETPRALGELMPALRGPRADAVMRALSRDASERYASVEQFAHALETARPGRSVRARRAGALLSVGALLFCCAGWYALQPRETGKLTMLRAQGSVGAMAVAQQPPPSAPQPTPRPNTIAMEGSGPDRDAGSDRPASSQLRPTARWTARARAARAAPAQSVAPAKQAQVRPVTPIVDRATQLTHEDF